MLYVVIIIIVCLALHYIQCRCVDYHIRWTWAKVLPCWRVRIFRCWCDYRQTKPHYQCTELRALQVLLCQDTARVHQMDCAWGRRRTCLHRYVNDLWFWDFPRNDWINWISVFVCVWGGQSVGLELHGCWCCVAVVVAVAALSSMDSSSVSLSVSCWSDSVNVAELSSDVGWKWHKTCYFPPKLSIIN